MDNVTFKLQLEKALLQYIPKQNVGDFLYWLKLDIFSDNIQKISKEDFSYFEYSLDYFQNETPYKEIKTKIVDGDITIIENYVKKYKLEKSIRKLSL